MGFNDGQFFVFERPWICILPEYFYCVSLPSFSNENTWLHEHLFIL